MSSPGFATTLDLRLKPSHRALRWLQVVHVAPLAGIAVAMQPGYAMMAVAAAFACSWWWLRRHAAFGFGPRALVRLLWQPGSGWQVWQQDGRHASATLQSDTYVHPLIVVLNFRLDGESLLRRSRSRVLLGDELPEDALRRLRALLRSVETTATPPDTSGSARPP